MADFLIFSPSLEAMDAVAQLISGLWIPTSTGPDGRIIPGHVGSVLGMPGIGEWFLTPPFQWYVPTGETYVDPFGNTQPVKAPKPGYFWLFRWNADFSELEPYIEQGGGTVSIDPDTGITIISAGPVTMTTPIPSGCPMSF